MIIFDDGRKVNFVDKNESFVGYDMYHQCSENAGWFICDEIKKNDIATENKHEVGEGGINADFSGYVFDSSFFDKSEWPCLDHDDRTWCDMVIFRLTKDGDGDKYLHIFNCHNGYYSHGIYTNGIDSVDKEFEL